MIMLRLFSRYAVIARIQGQQLEGGDQTRKVQCGKTRGVLGDLVVVANAVVVLYRHCPAVVLQYCFLNARTAFNTFSDREDVK